MGVALFKSSRPWYRAKPRYLVPFALLGGVFGYLASWALTAEPALRVDYQKRLSALSRDAQPPGANGWPHLAAATEVVQYGGPCGLTHLLDFNAVFSTVYEADGAACLQRTVRWMERSGVFDDLARAAECPNVVCRRPIDAETQLAQISTAGRGRALSMYLAAERDEPEEVVAALHDALFVARALSFVPGGPAPILATRVLTSVNANLHALLLDQEPDAAVLGQMLEILLVFRLAPPDLAVEGERLRLLDFVQRTHSDDGRGSGRRLIAGPSDPPVERLRNLSGLRYASRRALVDKADEYFDHALKVARRPAPLRRLHPLDTDGFAAALESRYELLVDALPYWLESILHQRDTAEGGLARLTVMVALELHRAERGAYPEQLGALVPGYLPDFSCGEVIPVFYRRIDEDPYGRGYLLYTAGLNWADDGGGNDDRVLNYPSARGAALLRAAAAIID